MKYLQKTNFLKMLLLVTIFITTAHSVSNLPPYRVIGSIELNGEKVTDITGYTISGVAVLDGVEFISTNLNSTMFKIDIDADYIDKVVKINITNPDGVALQISSPANATIVPDESGKTSIVAFKTSLGDTQSYDLKTGWNLISVPLDMTSTTASSFIDSVGGATKVSSAWTYNAAAGSWKTYDMELVSLGLGDLNDLKNIVPEKGYFLKLLADTSITIAGSSHVQSNMDLVTGWNLVGFVNNIKPDNLIAQLGATKVSSAWTYDAAVGSWKTYDMELVSLGLGDLNDLTQISVAKGYFIKMLENSTAQLDFTSTTATTSTATTTAATTATETATQAELLVVSSDKAALNLSSIDANAVKADITLPSSGTSGSTITWASSNATVVDVNGGVTQPSLDTAITLTATITKGSTSDTKVFSIIVKAVDTTVIAVVLDDTSSTAVEDTTPVQTFADILTNTVNTSMVFEVNEGLQYFVQFKAGNKVDLYGFDKNTVEFDSDGVAIKPSKFTDLDVLVSTDGNSITVGDYIITNYSSTKIVLKDGTKSPVFATVDASTSVSLDDKFNTFWTISKPATIVVDYAAKYEEVIAEETVSTETEAEITQIQSTGIVGKRIVTKNEHGDVQWYQFENDGNFVAMLKMGDESTNEAKDILIKGTYSGTQTITVSTKDPITGEELTVTPSIDFVNNKLNMTMAGASFTDTIVENIIKIEDAAFDYKDVMIVQAKEILIEKEESGITVTEEEKTQLLNDLGVDSDKFTTFEDSDDATKYVEELTNTKSIQLAAIANIIGKEVEVKTPWNDTQIFKVRNDGTLDIGKEEDFTNNWQSKNYYKEETVTDSNGGTLDVLSVVNRWNDDDEFEISVSGGDLLVRKEYQEKYNIARISSINVSDKDTQIPSDTEGWTDALVAKTLYLEDKHDDNGNRGRLVKVYGLAIGDAVKIGDWNKNSSDIYTRNWHDSFEIYEYIDKNNSENTDNNDDGEVDDEDRNIIKARSTYDPSRLLIVKLYDRKIRLEDVSNDIFSVLAISDLSTNDTGTNTGISDINNLINQVTAITYEWDNNRRKLLHISGNGTSPTTGSLVEIEENKNDGDWSENHRNEYTWVKVENTIVATNINNSADSFTLRVDEFGRVDILRGSDDIQRIVDVKDSTEDDANVIDSSAFASMDDFNGYVVAYKYFNDQSNDWAEIFVINEEDGTIEFGNRDYDDVNLWGTYDYTRVGNIITAVNQHNSDDIRTIEFVNGKFKVTNQWVEQVEASITDVKDSNGNIIVLEKSQNFMLNTLDDIKGKIVNVTMSWGEEKEAHFITAGTGTAITFLKLELKNIEYNWSEEFDLKKVDDTDYVGGYYLNAYRSWDKENPLKIYVDSKGRLIKEDKWSNIKRVVEFNGTEDTDGVSDIFELLGNEIAYADFNSNDNSWLELLKIDGSVDGGMLQFGNKDQYNPDGNYWGSYDYIVNGTTIVATDIYNSDNIREILVNKTRVEITEIRKEAMSVQTPADGTVFASAENAAALVMVSSIENLVGNVITLEQSWGGEQELRIYDNRVKDFDNDLSGMMTFKWNKEDQWFDKYIWTYQNDNTELKATRVNSGSNDSILDLEEFGLNLYRHNLDTENFEIWSVNEFGKLVRENAWSEKLFPVAVLNTDGTVDSTQTIDSLSDMTGKTVIFAQEWGNNGSNVGKDFDTIASSTNAYFRAIQVDSNGMEMKFGEYRTSKVNLHDQRDLSQNIDAWWNDWADNRIVVGFAKENTDHSITFKKNNSTGFTTPFSTNTTFKDLKGDSFAKLKLFMNDSANNLDGYVAVLEETWFLDNDENPDNRWFDIIKFNDIDMWNSGNSGDYVVWGNLNNQDELTNFSNTMDIEAIGNEYKAESIYGGSEKKRFSFTKKDLWIDGQDGQAGSLEEDVVFLDMMSINQEEMTISLQEATIVKPNLSFLNEGTDGGDGVSIGDTGPTLEELKTELDNIPSFSVPSVTDEAYWTNKELYLAEVWEDSYNSQSYVKLEFERMTFKDNGEMIMEEIEPEMEDVYDATTGNITGQNPIVDASGNVIFKTIRTNYGTWYWNGTAPSISFEDSWMEDGVQETEQIDEAIQFGEWIKADGTSAGSNTAIIGTDTDDDGTVEDWSMKILGMKPIGQESVMAPTTANSIVLTISDISNKKITFDDGTTIEFNSDQTFNETGTDDGQSYTENGNWTIDSDGKLAMQDSDGGGLLIEFMSMPANGVEIKIYEDGSIETETISTFTDMTSGLATFPTSPIIAGVADTTPTPE
mgnify:FL=1